MGLGALQSDTGDTNQAAFALDDGVGLRVVRANFVDERKFDWDLFNGLPGVACVDLLRKRQCDHQNVG